MIAFLQPKTGDPPMGLVQRFSSKLVLAIVTFVAITLLAATLLPGVAGAGEKK